MWLSYLLFLVAIRNSYVRQTGSGINGKNVHVFIESVCLFVNMRVDLYTELRPTSGLKFIDLHTRGWNL